MVQFSLSAILALTLPTAFVVNASANEIVRDVDRDLRYDENGKLVKHTVLYTPACSQDLFQTERYGFDYRMVAGDAEEQVFSLENISDCRAVCVERGVDRSVAHAVLPERFFKQTNGGFSFADWMQERCMKQEICIMNYVDKTNPLQLYWFNENTGAKQLHIEVLYGEQNTRCFHSFLGHKFKAETVHGQPIGEFTVEYTGTMWYGEAPPSDQIEGRSFEDEIKATLDDEWNKHNMVKRTFSTLGFRKGRLPPDVFASMGAFYYNNRGNKVREEWGGRGVFVNWWENDCSFIQIPWHLKKIWQLRLLELVEAWAGVPVEETSMYGLRQYEEGARLLTHVDRISTHAVSLIVNIAQGNLTEPWPVEVQDHMDRLHEVTMQPGDIVYYESAKCLHARNRPLMGRDAYYVNLFTHYRPTGDDKWYEKPNHAGTPPPLMEVKGECRLEKMGTTETATGALGLVEGVKCDDRRLGPYISPTLFTARSGDDLMDWWRYTSPEKKNIATV